MLNTLVNSMIMVGEDTLGLFKELFINPLNGTFSFMIEYFAAKPTIVSILGLLTSFYLFALATSAAVLLLKAGISYCIFCYKEKRRRELAAIRRRERRRAEERLAYDQQFDELYETFVL